MFSPKLVALQDLWQSKLNGRDLPLRSDIPPEELKQWMGNLALCEVEPDPLRFRLRLVGTRIRDYDGADYTGRYLDEVLSPAIRPIVLSQWRRCVESRRPVLVHHREKDPIGRPVVIDKLFLPVSMHGESVDQVFVYIEVGGDWSDGRVRRTLQDVERGGASAVLAHGMIRHK